MREKYKRPAARPGVSGKAPQSEITRLHNSNNSSGTRQAPGGCTCFASGCCSFCCAWHDYYAAARGLRAIGH